MRRQIKPNKMLPYRTPQAAYEEFLARFKSLTDQEIIERFNEQIGNNGWTSSRGSYLAALHDEFLNRGFDFSAIGGSESLSLRSKIRLSGKTLEALDPSATTGPAMIRVPSKEQKTKRTR